MLNEREGEKILLFSANKPLYLRNGARQGLQGAAENSGPLNFFAIFSATVWDFNMKFSRFIY